MATGRRGRWSRRVRELAAEEAPVSRWRLALGGALHEGLGALAATVVMVASAAGSLVLHGDLPVTRRFVARTVTALLEPLFEGQIVLRQVDHLGFDGLDAQSVEVLDPWGRRVIGLEGVHARFGVVSAVQRIVLSGGAIVLTVDDVHVDRAEVDVDTSPDGRIRIAAAFTPRPSPPGPVGAPRPRRPLRIELPRVHVAHGWAHGEPVAGLPLQASASRMPASALVTEQGVTVDVERFALRSQLLAPLNPTGTADYHLRVDGGEPRMWASFHGRLGEVTADASARLVGKTLEGRVDVLRAEPDQVRSLVPQLSLAEAATAHAEVSGTLPDLHGTARLQVGISELEATLDARLVEGLELAARWSATSFNPRQFTPAAPVLGVSADGEARLRLGPAGLRAEVEATTTPLAIAGQVLPGAKIEAWTDGKRAGGTVVPLEPGVDGSLTFAVDPGEPARVDGTLRAADLRRVARLGGAVEGRAEAHLAGQLGRDGALDASVTATYAGLGVDALRVERGTVAGRLSGPLDRLRLDATVGADRLSLGRFALERATLRAGGSPLAPTLRLSLDDPRWSRLELTAGLNLTPRPSLRQLAVRFEGGELAADVRAASVEVAEGAVSLRGLDVSGPALQAKGDVRVSAGGFRLDLRDGFVDLAQLGRFLAPRVGVAELGSIDDGRVRFEARLDAEGARRSGSASVRLDGLCYQRQPVVLEGDARLALDDDRATASVSAEAVQATCRPRPDEVAPQRPVLASARAQAAGTLPGSLLDGRTWRAATGEVQLQELLVSLDHVSSHPLVAALRTLRAARAPAAPAGLGEQLGGVVPVASGALRASGTLARLEPRGAPSARLDLATDGLRLEAPLADHPRLQRVEGLDLRSTLIFRPAEAAGSVVTGVEVSLRQGERELGQVALAAAPALEALLAGVAGAGDPARRPALLAWLRGLPVRGSFAWRPVDLDELPAVLRPAGVRGRLSLEGTLGGTPDAPTVSFRAAAADLASERGGWEQWRLAGSVEGTLDERGMAVRGSLQHRAEKLAGAEGSATFWATSTQRLGDALWGREPRWQLDAQATLDRWRLEAVPPLAAAGLRGQVTGVAQALRMHVQPVLWVDLRLDEGKVHDAALAPTTVRASLLEGGGFVTVAMEQPSSPGRTPGALSLTALPTLTFRDRLVPALDRGQAHTVALRASHFDIQPLSPLVTPVLADLRGTIDGEVSVTVGARPEQNSIAGKLQWREGVVLIPQLGQTLSQGRFDLTTSVRSDGETRVELTDLALSATTGRITGAAGFAIPGDFLARRLFPPPDGAPASTPLKGQFAARIAAGEAIPVTFEGLALGDAHGVIDGFLLLDDAGLKAQIAIPDLTFELPESLGQQSLQSLGDNPDIGLVGSRLPGRRPGDPIVVAHPLPIFIVVGVGSHLEELLGNTSPTGSVLVRRAGLDVRLAGQLQLAFADELLAGGTIETLSGRVVALGKPFDIRPGIVRFEGTATNPFLNVGATWDAPDGTRVFADLLGYLREAELRLRSEPARSEGQVLSLVLFGRDPGAAVGPTGATGTSNTNSLAAGGGVASTLINSFIDPVQVFGRRVEVRVDNTLNRGTTYGAATEIRPKLWVQVDVSTTPQRERQNGDLSALTLDWRFRNNWSLRSILGDRGSSLLELLWQFRY